VLSEPSVSDSVSSLMYSPSPLPNESELVWLSNVPEEGHAMPDDEGETKLVWTAAGRPTWSNAERGVRDLFASTRKSRQALASHPISRRQWHVCRQGPEVGRNLHHRAKSTTQRRTTGMMTALARSSNVFDT
jgi:hypothetical protein